MSVSLDDAPGDVQPVLHVGLEPALGSDLRSKGWINQGRGTVDVKNLLPPLLRAWAQIAGERAFPAEVTPWWFDPNALIQSIGQAAEAIGWRVQPGLDEEWDMHLTTPDMRMAIRCVGAGVAIGSGADGRSVIADAWRVLALTPPPSRGTCGVHLVVVQPHMAHAGAEVAIRSAMGEWRAANPWPQDGMSVWVDATSPVPRNTVGTAFPGLGLMARAVTGSQVVRPP